jgi:hypothetical protein
LVGTAWGDCEQWPRGGFALFPRCLQRRIIRLALTAANLVAECRTLKKYNIDFVHKVSYRQADILTRLSGVMDVSGTFAHAELEDSVSRLQQDLEQWYAQSPGMAMDPRTHMGSLAMWHACKILLRRDLQNQSRADSDIQASVRATLELCLEAGDKIEYMNWVSKRGGASCVPLPSTALPPR